MRTCENCFDAVTQIKTTTSLSSGIPVQTYPQRMLSYVKGGSLNSFIIKNPGGFYNYRIIGVPESTLHHC